MEVRGQVVQQDEAKEDDQRFMQRVSSVSSIQDIELLKEVSKLKDDKIAMLQEKVLSLEKNKSDKKELKAQNIELKAKLVELEISNKFSLEANNKLQ